MTLRPDDVAKVYDWRQSQATALGSACFTLSGLILSPLLAAVFDDRSQIRPLYVGLYVAGALLAAISGVVWHREARRLQNRFVADADTDILVW